MNLKNWMPLTSIALAACVLCITVNLLADTDEDTKSRPNEKTNPASTERPDDEKLVTVAVARERAKLTHEIYAATLDVMHHRYFLNERSTIPARAMEDVFKTIERESNITARWISVNAKAMSIDHEPETAFERKAARSLARGEAKIEVVQDGYYRRAGRIRLTTGCISCHVGFAADAKVDRFAGLVISIPIREE